MIDANGLGRFSVGGRSNGNDVFNANNEVNEVNYFGKQKKFACVFMGLKTSGEVSRV